MAKKQATRRNPNDLTLRNAKAYAKRLAALEMKVYVLVQRVRALEGW